MAVLLGILCAFYVAALHAINSTTTLQPIATTKPLSQSTLLPLASRLKAPPSHVLILASSATSSLALSSSNLSSSSSSPLISSPTSLPKSPSPRKLPPLQPLPIPESITPHLAAPPPHKLEFIISYKAQIHDGIIIGERYSVSDPITKKARLLPIHHTCEIDTPITNLITDDEIYAIKYMLTHYVDSVIDCLRKGLASVRYDGTFSHYTRVLDSTLLSFPPQRILAYLHNRHLIIDVLQEHPTPPMNR